jgi:hypothetical protein
MKKVLLAAALMISSVAAFAQHAVGTVTIQPKVGLNIANFTDADDADARVGFVAGAELEYQASDIFSISAGALYSQQGCKGKEAGVTLTQKLDYINVPIMANVYVAPGFAVKLGVQPGFKVNAEAEAKNGSNRIAAGNSSEFNSVDFSIPVGVSYEFSNVVLDARYNWGLTKTFKDLDNKNTVFQFTVGYKFAL